MNSDDFEKRLQRAPLRKVPPEWREQILKGATASEYAQPGSRDSFLSTFNSHLSTILWPNPKAWMGLAAVWVLIFVINSETSSRAPIMAKSSTPAEMAVTLKDQQKILAELMNNSAPREIDTPQRFSPQPHSERRESLSMT